MQRNYYGENVPEVCLLRVTDDVIDVDDVAFAWTEFSKNRRSSSGWSFPTTLLLYHCVVCQ